MTLDRRHIVVGEAEMMADFVNQHMADDMAQRIVVFGPVIQDRAAIQPDHVGKPGDVVMATEGQADALEQAEQVEFAGRAHLVENFVGGKVVNADDDALAQFAKAFRQALEDFVRHGFHFGKRGRFRGGPHRVFYSVFERSGYRFGPQALLTSARQSETLPAITGSWWAR